MLKKLGWFSVALILAFAPAWVLLRAWGDLPALTADSFLTGSFTEELEAAVAQTMPGHSHLRRLGLQLGLLGGRQEQNNIFISENGLIYNIPAADSEQVRCNAEAILDFASQAEVPTYLTLIPTSSAILQQQLPSYAELHNNQKQLIEDVYYQMTGQVTVMDVYPVLFGVRDRYIYYRTENNLTALGGYYVYSVISNKLVGSKEALDISQFSVTYEDAPYYGSLYQSSPFQGVRGDVLSYYRYTRYSREFIVTHLEEGGERTYHTLYPLHLEDLNRRLDTYFGGLSPVVHLRASSPYARSLLVFGDETALAYLPFLANNYQEVTLVDLSQLTPELSSAIDPQAYAQILFAYSVETFDTEIPAMALQLLSK